MLIDNNLEYQILVPYFLRRRMEVYSMPCESSKKGLELLFFGESFDLVICEFQMPEIDGVEVCRRMRAAKIEIPFILYSNCSSLIISEHEKLNFLAVIRKFELELLTETIVNFYSSKQLRSKAPDP